MKIISGTANPNLAIKVAKILEEPLCKAEIKRFADGEIFAEIQDNLRGEDVFIIQPFSRPVNDNIMELLILLDVIKRSSVSRVNVVIPYMGYARQDRKVAPQTPISAKLLADILTTAGADRVITIDLHNQQSQGFYDIPVDNLRAFSVFSDDIISRFEDKKAVIVSPDVGGVIRARYLAKLLHLDLAIIDKRREHAGASEVMNVIGDVKGCDCIITDDLIDSGGTLCNAANALIEKGATSVTAYISHGIFSGNALEKIEKSKIEKMYITDSIDNWDKIKDHPKIEVISVANMLARAIYCINNEQSIDDLMS